jgi:hypothetical protein
MSMTRVLNAPLTFFPQAISGMAFVLVRRQRSRCAIDNASATLGCPIDLNNDAATKRLAR